MNQLPDQIGPFHIIEELGRGAMGVVYRGKHTVTSEPAAVKTLHEPNPLRVESIRREIRALARINHPGIVRILDEGVLKGLPWYAMEFLEGITLRDFNEKIVWGRSIPDVRTESEMPWWIHEMGKTVDADVFLKSVHDEDHQTTTRVPDASETRVPAAGGFFKNIVPVLCRLCQTLAFLHGEGIIHGDFKPDNVIVLPNGMPVIMDFGLVTHFGGVNSRETMEIEGVLGGSAGYAAPEQIRGELLDARADLYALGCILYEFLTGRSPFEGSHPVQIMKAQLGCEIIPPSKLVQGVPEELDLLVMHLLERDYWKRMGHADHLITVLSNLDDNKGKRIGEELPRSKAYLYRSRFAGRNPVFNILRDQLRTLKDGSGNLVFISGESGLGKTRFLLELARVARQNEMKVLSGECVQPGAFNPQTNIDMSSPLQAMRRAIRGIVEYCREKGQDETDRVLGARGKVLAKIEAGVMDLPGQDAYPDPAELPVDAARLRFFNYLSETFTALAEFQPVLLVLDDLHWADNLTLLFLEFLVRIGRLSQVPLLIVATFRTGEVKSGLQRILDRSKTKPVELELLKEDAVRAIVADMMALPEPSHLFVTFLTDHAEGNPFFISEYLRMAVAEGLLYRDSQGRWQVSNESDQEASIADLIAMGMPRSLVDLVERRLESLSDRGIEVISAAAVMGVEFPLILLWNVVPNEVTYLDTIDKLIKSHILVESRQGYLRFTQKMTRQIVHERLTPEKRRHWHLTTAKALESLHGSEDETQFTSLAQHWFEAGEQEKAVEYFIKAGNYSQKSYDNHAAIDAYSIVISLLPDSDQRKGRVLGDRGFVYRVIGRLSKAKADLDMSLTIAQNLKDRKGEALSINNLGLIHSFQGRNEKAMNCYLQSLEIYREINNRIGEAWLINNIGNIYLENCRYDDALRYHQQALDIYTEREDRRGEAASYHNIGNVHLLQSRYDEALLCFQKSLEKEKEIGRKSGEAYSLGNIGIIHAYQGRYEDALKCYKHAQILEKETGDRRAEAALIGNLGMLFSIQDKYDEALDCYRQTLEIGKETGDRKAVATSLSNIGMIHGNNGRYAEALDWCRQALKIRKEINDTSGVASSLSSISTSYFFQGKHTETLEFSQKALKIEQEIGDRKGEAESLYLMANTHACEGHNEKALQFYDQAIFIHDELGWKHENVLTHSLKARVLLKTDDSPGAAELSHNAMSFLEETDPDRTNRDMEPEQILFTHYRVLDAVNDVNADHYLEEAYRVLNKYTDKISDPQGRQNILNTPLNQPIVEAWEMVFNG